MSISCHGLPVPCWFCACEGCAIYDTVNCSEEEQNLDGPVGVCNCYNDSLRMAPSCRNMWQLICVINGVSERAYLGFYMYIYIYIYNEIIYQLDAIEYLFVFFQLDMFRAYTPIFRSNGC